MGSATGGVSGDFGRGQREWFESGFWALRPGRAENKSSLIIGMGGISFFVAFPPHLAHLLERTALQLLPKILC